MKNYTIPFRGDFGMDLHSRRGYVMLQRQMNEPYSLYLHIPFCRKRCSYCDFNTYAGQEDHIEAYVDALCQEMRFSASTLPHPLPIHTVFFGGGTPSLLSAEQVKRILATAATAYDFQPDMEISLEANPGTVTPESLAGLREAGVNRLSFGMQSAHPQELRFLQRVHDYPEVIQAVQWARQAGFDNLNLDLIYALPGQLLERWQNSLKLAVGLQPEHISLYSLTVEEGTLLHRQVGRGLLPPPQDDDAADMYEWAMDWLPSQGYEQYEISNFARRSPQGDLLACCHNLQYWRAKPYLGLGAGAHGYAVGYRTVNVAGILPYIRRCGLDEALEFPFTPANSERIVLSHEDEMQEAMMVGLRLTDEGMRRADFAARFGVEVESVFGRQIRRLVQQGLLEWAGEDGDALRLTHHGRLLGNRVFMEFVGELR